jgi:hypothetical protein
MRTRRLGAKKESMDAFDSRQDCHNFTNVSRRAGQLPNQTIPRRRGLIKRGNLTKTLKRRKLWETCRAKFVELG